MRFASISWSIALALVLPIVAQAVPAQPMNAMTGSKSKSQVQVPLRAQNGSGVHGMATLSQFPGGTQVIITTVGQPANSMPAHIHTGTCSNLDPTPKYPLTSIATGVNSAGHTIGFSKTFIKGLRLTTLVAKPYAINVHKSAIDLKDYVSCGDLKYANPTGI